MKIRSSPMWPVMFHVAEWDEAAREKPALVALCRRLQEAKREWGLAPRAKRNLFESPPELFSHPEARGLLAFCGAVVCNVFQKDATFPESWCHVTNGGGFHDAHAHADFVRGVCGIYYLQTAECTLEPPNGINRFYAPDVFQENDVADFLPKEGQLLLFPGNVRHSALPYAGKEDRIVISFNARLTSPVDQENR